MEKKAILYLVIGILIGVIAIRAVPMMTGFATVVTTATTGNLGPTVDEIVVNDGDTITLISGSTKTVWCNATVSDPNGHGDIVEVKAIFEYFFYDGLEEGAWDSAGYDNINFRYIQQNDSTTWAGYDTTKLNVSFEFELEYNTVPGKWHCIILVNDTDGETDSDYKLATIATLNALDTDDTIDFGSIVPETPSGEVEHPIRNFGNVMIDLTVLGNLMDCSEGEIPAANVRYDLFSSALYNAMTEAVNAGTPNYLFNLGKKTLNDTVANATRTTYWRVEAPTGVKGSCAGTVDLTANNGDYNRGSSVEDPTFKNITTVIFSQNPDDNMYYALIAYETEEDTTQLVFRNSTDASNWDTTTVVTAVTGNFIETNSPVIVLSDGNLTVLYSNWNGTYYNIYMKKSTDGGQTWGSETTVVAGEKNETRPSAVIDSDGYIHVVFNSETTGPNRDIGTSGTIAGYIRSEDNGTSWTGLNNTITTGALNPSLAIDSSDKLFLAYTNDFSTEVIVSTNGGTTWSRIDNDWSCCPSWQWVHEEARPTALVSKDDIVWIFQEYWYPNNTNKFIVFLRSFDGGVTWDVPVTVTSGDASQQTYPGAGIINNGDIWITWRNESENAGFISFEYNDSTLLTTPAIPSEIYKHY